MSDTYTLVFAKAPVPGQVKTRLIPALGAAGAALLASRLLDDTLRRALAADVGPVDLCASPAVTRPDWASQALPAGLAFSDQGAGDLGARMARAARRHLAAGRRVLLIGTDCPALSAMHLREAAASMEDHQAAMVPARDGGYVLLGLRSFHPSLFADLPWGTAAVADLTLARIAALGWHAWVGAPLADIDEPSDLGELTGGLSRGLPFRATGGDRLRTRLLVRE